MSILGKFAPIVPINLMQLSLGLTIQTGCGEKPLGSNSLRISGQASSQPNTDNIQNVNVNAGQSTNSNSNANSGPSANSNSNPNAKSGQTKKGNPNSASVDPNTQPTDPICPVSNGAGAKPTSTVTNVAANCSEFFSLPQNAATFTSLGSPILNRIHSYGSRLFVATQGGLSISSDGGKTWITKTTANGLASNRVNSLHANEFAVYAATPRGLSISKDQGTTWITKTKEYGLASNSVIDVVASGNTVYTLVAATPTSTGPIDIISISSDGGVTWKNKTLPESSDTLRVNRLFVDSNNVYAATTDGLFVSSNQGMNWIKKNAPTRATPVFGQNTFRGIFPSGNTIYAATAGGLLVSKNGGTDWEYKTLNGIQANNVMDVKGSGNTIYALLFRDNQIYSSTNGGESWTNRSVTVAGRTHNIEGIYPIGNSIYLNSNMGLLFSADNGLNWTQQTSTNNLGTPMIRGVFASGNTIYVASSTGLSISKDGGATWTKRVRGTGGLSNYFRAVHVVGKRIYAAYQGKVAISDDDGVSWTDKTVAEGTGILPVTAVSGSGATIYATTTSETESVVYESNDAGASWKISQKFAGKQVSGVHEFAGVLYGVNQNGLGLFISTDGGKTWINKTTANGLAHNRIFGVYASEGTIYAATSAGLSVSTNKGETWEINSIGNPSTNISISGVHGSGNSIYVATEEGLFVKKPIIPVR